MTRDNEQKHIIFDIGHARRTGAAAWGREEHEEAAALAAELRLKGEGAGFAVTVLDFPEKTNRADLNATIEAANAMKADFGISLHFDCATQRVQSGTDEEGEPLYNEFPDTRARGAHVCYLSDQGKRMAGFIAARLCALLPGRAQRTVYRNDLAVLKHTRAPWALVECGFITSPADMNFVTHNREAVAAAIIGGIADYFEA